MATLLTVKGVSAAPRPVAAIIAAVHNDLQGRYTAARKTLSAEDALASSLLSKMTPKDYQAVEGFFNGTGSDEAAIYGAPIHDRLLMALEWQDSRALAVATSSWNQDSHTGAAVSANGSGKPSTRRRVVTVLLGVLFLGYPRGCLIV
jgi:hypothetical protein